MIHLRPDCLVFKTKTGENIPCSVADVSVELVGAALGGVDEEIIQNAAQAVLYYFKTELGRTSVTIGEFTEALEKALRGLGLEINSATPEMVSPPRVLEYDLQHLAGESETAGFELIFFSRLRAELRLKLNQSPQVLRFRGLRGCVLQLSGAKRWSVRCQSLSDQIVDFLRTCLQTENERASCALVVL